MKNFIITFCSFYVILIFSCVKEGDEVVQMNNQTNMTHSYLALGDSYTIGESVPAPDNFPNQTVLLLKNAGYDLKPAEILAKTGWTTDELQNNINNHSFTPPYDIVTLLIATLLFTLKFCTWWLVVSTHFAFKSILQYIMLSS